MAYHEFTVKVSDQFKDALVEKLLRIGSLGAIESSDGLVAYFPDTVPSSVITTELQLIKALLEKSDQAHKMTYKHALIPHEDWNESWKKGFITLDVGVRFTILPPWEKMNSTRVNLVIDPAMAFGTGHHETTRSCLILMEKYADMGGKERFLDLGTGTGLLAIAASKLGYAEVIGVDTDPLATEAALKNIDLNHAGNVHIYDGSISTVEGAYDFIAANLISGVLVLLATDIADHLHAPGLAVLSGILVGQEDEVIEAMRNAGLVLVEKLVDGKWVSVVVRRDR